MGFVSFLEKAGKDILKVITVGSEAAVLAAPAVSVYNPAIGQLLAGSATAILTAEVAGQSAVANAPAPDNGAQKAALAVTAITPLADQFAQTVGVSRPTETQILKFNDALVLALKAFGVAEELSKPAA